MSEKPLRLEWIPAADLAGNPNNWRQHPELQRDALDALLFGEDAVGWAGAALFNELTGRLIDGHLRREVGIIHDEPIPVLIGSWTEEEEKRILATLDPIAAMAEANREKLGALLQSVQSDQAAVQEMLAGLAEREGVVFGGNGQPPEDPGPQVDRSQELAEQWGTALGQVWTLGEHRLVCGDCTDKEVVNAVAFGNADLIVSDPPYSVSYADKNKSLNAVAFGNRIQTPIEGDHLSLQEVTERIWVPAFNNMFSVTKSGGVFYVCTPQASNEIRIALVQSILGAGWYISQDIIWVKNNHVLGRADYQYKHEPIIYGWKPGAAHYFIDSRSEVSTWEIDKPLNSDLHPTQKPLELVERAIRNSSIQGEIVADFFVGSGTTLIGCQKLGRRCMAIDLDPSYCAVTLQRWHDLTGLDPQRID